ncbi:hypothetical protein [Ancylobacter oerskovii]|uniref:Uncharacterized protein n=1 Tax=Ancylobacter oerskovii TaxID=459519 RepID=A0ABW4Z4W7_9HYPH|nr:hypothetical protein [Ancylobacter oerskovii]MBS7542452.1 hypothetical protein [Ancylobacter oerskovii]
MAPDIAHRRPRRALRRLGDECETIAKPSQGAYLDRPARPEDGSAYR